VAKTLGVPTATQFPNLTICSANAAATVANNVVTWTVNTGFPGSLLTQSQVSSLTGTQGTRLAVTFTNLNPGVNYYVPTSPAATNVTLTAYTSATTATPASAASTSSITTLNGLTTSVLLTPTNGSATIYYGVTNSASTPGTPLTQSFTIPLYENIPTASAVTSFAALPSGISITLASGAGSYPQYSTSQTPDVGAQVTTTPTTEGLLSACNTTLLFPYIVNTSGFDTGVVITNASTGSGTSVTPAAGTCSVTFYGTGAPATAYTTPVLATASNTVFAASAQAPGVDGYAVATCNFQGAHGYAFVFSGAGTPEAYAADYLAVVIASSGVTPTTVAF